MRVNKNSLSRVILEILAKSVDASVRLIDFAEKTHLYAYSNRWEKELPKSALSKALIRLNKKGLIEKEFIDEELIIRLTSAGRLLLPEDETKWDGKWIVVVFDIPEQKRLIRNIFRRFLKKLGFKQLQKSVFISKKSLFEKLAEEIKTLEIESWVTIFQTDRIKLLPKT